MSICRIVVIVFAVLWIAAVCLLAIGAFGWFGQEPDPLSGVFLIPLGLPWIIIADALGISGALVAILAPGINLLILMAICRLLARRA